jgi:hypothetical protein
MRLPNLSHLARPHLARPHPAWPHIGPPSVKAARAPALGRADILALLLACTLAAAVAAILLTPA